MADKSVGELMAATSVTPADLFVLEQSGVAKKLTGQTLENWLLAMADGHGGIQSIAKASTSGLVDTYRITLADESTYDFKVTNGRSITSFKKTSSEGLSDLYTIRYNDGSSAVLTIKNGEKGEKGDNQYVWIKYASQEPTASSHSFGDVPDNWIGIYSGDADTAPADWTAYSWFEIKGAKGDTGAAASLMSAAVEYQVSDSGTIIPSGAWVTSVPVVAQGKYLWTRTTNEFNSGLPVVSYSVSRMGLDGSGSVSSVANISPDPNGNVPLTAENIGALPISGGTMTGPVNMNGQILNGLNAPTQDDEAATRGYTNTQITDRAIKSGGKNMFDVNQTVPSNTTNTAVEISENTVRVHSTTSSGSNHATKGNIFLLKANVPYIMSATIDRIVKGTISIGLRSAKAQGSHSANVVLKRASVTTTGRHTVLYTPTENVEAYASLFVTGSTSGETGDATFSDIMVEEGSVATPYEPYYKGLSQLTAELNEALMALLGV